MGLAYNYYVRACVPVVSVKTIKCVLSFAVVMSFTSEKYRASTIYCFK